MPIHEPNILAKLIRAVVRAVLSLFRRSPKD